MLTLQVNDMTCGHCASHLARALKAIDPNARVDIDLNSRRVHIESSDAEASEFAEAITEAGYTPRAVALEFVAAKTTSPGGCCGCCR